MCYVYMLSLSISAWIFATVRGHVCLLTLQWDESQQRDRWSMPSLDRCYCQRVMKMRKPRQSCPGVQDNKAHIELWFTDHQDLLTHRGNWTRDTLDRLLGRVDFCCKLLNFDKSIKQLRRVKRNNDLSNII